MDIINSVIAFLAQETLFDYVSAILILLATAAVARIVVKALRHILDRDEITLPSVSILINIVRVTVWLIGISIVLDSCFGINANALITALGVGGVALSLGLQDTLKNLIGGLQVTFMHIIAPGDNIDVGGKSGVVQDITWRHTTIEDSLGQRILIPNSVISSTSLTQLLPETRVTVPVSIPRPFALDIESDAEAPDPKSAHGLSTISQKLADATREAVAPVSRITSGPTILFSEIEDRSVKGKIIFQVEDADKTFAAADATVRAIAKLLG